MFLDLFNTLLRYKFIYFFSACQILIFSSCTTEHKQVTKFEDTEAYKLAQAVDKSKIHQVEKLLKTRPELLKVSSKSGMNVLELSIFLEEMDAFKKLLELGADPNYINPLDSQSVLMKACRPFGSAIYWRENNKYAELLLEYGADPNYSIRKKFTNSNGITNLAGCPISKASRLNLDLVKTLIKYGAEFDIYVDDQSPFSEAVGAGKFDIIDYYIDSLNTDVHKPMAVVIRKPSHKEVTFYI